ncbi:hypothetical protein QVD17_06812 [Tagetes erecta]|uniref:SET domain-containing protein n=1 Tax=Tagetes erecta TaxID=13708 RepID=A0AAD8LKY1_TARER|nr:hypothetical protein QVD17_06812 [Tagetes erecta]
MFVISQDERGAMFAEKCLRRFRHERRTTDIRLLLCTPHYPLKGLEHICINVFRVELAGNTYVALAGALVDSEAAVGNAVYMLPSFYNHNCDLDATQFGYKMWKQD